ncbi:MAG: hypothetical protein HY331_16005 [Chloroflexi bacterium]|nr:hypothetical protein [Chloroflexota bacterium]
MMTTRTKAAIGGVLIGLALLALAAGPLFAQTPEPTATPTPAPGAPITHEQMNQMMDAMHGEGASKRMHEAMGPDADKLMDQCVATMGTMQNMQGMMGGMSGMMGGQNGQSMQGMMGGAAGMMGR